MSTGSLPWYVARAGGLVSWYLLAASVIWGLLLSSKMLGRIGNRRWLLDLHRFLGGLGVIFVGVHLTGILLDTYVDFGLREVLIPFTSTWRPGAVAWGIVAFYVLIAVELTSLVRKRIPRKLWRVVHFGSFGLFVMATVHLLTAGTDATNPIVRWSTVVAVGTVTFLTCYRILMARIGRRASARPARPTRPVQPVQPVSAGQPAALVATPAAAPPPVAWYDTNTNANANPHQRLARRRLGEHTPGGTARAGDRRGRVRRLGQPALTCFTAYMA